MKARTVKIEDYIKECTGKNGGVPTKLYGPNGFICDLTVRNWERLVAETVRLADEKQKSDK